MDKRVANFNKLSVERRMDAQELSDILRQNGGNPPDGPSTGNDLHRAWINIDAAFNGNELNKVLNTLLEHDAEIKAAYREALEHELPVDITDKLKNQQEMLKPIWKQISSLRSPE